MDCGFAYFLTKDLQALQVDVAATDDMSVRKSLGPAQRCSEIHVCFVSM